MTHVLLASDLFGQLDPSVGHGGYCVAPPRREIVTSGWDGYSAVVAIHTSRRAALDWCRAYEDCGVGYTAHMRTRLSCAD